MLTMSIVGLYRYDNTIFDGLILPEGMTKDILVPNLLIELAELEIRFPRPDTIKEAITAWGSRRLPIWQKLYNTTQLNYNPIYNKDAWYSDVENRDLLMNRNRRNTNTGEASTSATTTEKVTSFNANTFQNSGQTETTGETSSEYTNQEYITDNDTGYIHRDRREYGNIGVTTTQQMIQAERDVVQFDMYEYIIADFKERFCIMIY